MLAKIIDYSESSGFQELDIDSWSCDVIVPNKPPVKNQGETSHNESDVREGLCGVFLIPKDKTIIRHNSDTGESVLQISPDCFPGKSEREIENYLRDRYRIKHSKPLKQIRFINSMIYIDIGALVVTANNKKAAELLNKEIDKVYTDRIMPRSIYLSGEPLKSSNWTIPRIRAFGHFISNLKGKYQRIVVVNELDSERPKYFDNQTLINGLTQKGWLIEKDVLYVSQNNFGWMGFR